MRGIDRQPLTQCPHCGCRELFVRKDFPQKLGLAIVIVAAVAFIVLAASRTTFWIGALVLVAAVVVDLVLYLFVPRITVCYRCRAEFRDVPVNPEHEGYDLAVGEKYR
jgi:cell division protein FtsW (lipid II flippase)